MRLKRVRINRGGPDEGIAIWFTSDGVDERISCGIPEGWDAMDRAAKIAYVKGQVDTHMFKRILVAPMEDLFPDPTAADDAKDGFEAIPGWSTWTPAEAETWIEANVTDLATAKVALGKLAAAVLFLRDIVIER